MASLPLEKNDFKRMKQYILGTGIYAKRNLCLFMIGVFTGYRISELCSLEIQNVMKFPPKINDRITVARSKMKGKYDSRCVPLNPKCHKYIRDYLDDWDNMYEPFCDKKILSNPLFPSRNSIIVDGVRKPKPVSARMISYIFENAAKELKIENLSTHTMRKNFAKSCYENLNKELILVQRALSHKSVTSTQKYINFDTEQVDEGILKNNIDDDEDVELA